MNGQEGETKHDKLFLRLKILFAGYEPTSEGYDSTVDYFIDQVLFKAYRYVIELRELLDGYLALKEEEKTSNKLEQLLEKIEAAEYGGRRFGVEMSKVEIHALLDQVKGTAPYRSQIDRAEHGVFNNLEYFMDIANGLRKVHLKKANELLPQVFNNLVNRSNIKELLNEDLKETQENYSQIEQEVEKKVDAVDRMTGYYSSFFGRLEERLSAL